MNESGMLKGKRAGVFGAGGSIGSAVARAFSDEGAEVFMAGRTASGLDPVATQIKETGGLAHTAVVDALDDEAVAAYIDQVADAAGGIDIEFNAVGPRVSEYASGGAAIALPLEQFLCAQTVLASQFITARCAARRMADQGSGVIIVLTGSPARPHSLAGTSGIGAAFGGIENLTRTMALELSGTGVRVVCLRTAANPDTRTQQDIADLTAPRRNITSAEALAALGNSTMLRVSPYTTDTANGAVLLASDLARMMTGTVHNATAGLCPD